MEYLFLLSGILILVVGGDFLVKSAIGLNNKFKLSPLLIGTTVVSFGTSAPELIVSVQATLDGNPGVAIGNVVGSNIANLGLVLGLVVLIRPIVVNHKKYGLSYLIMFLSAVIFYLVSYNGSISYLEGVFLLLGLVVFLFLSIRWLRILYHKDISLVKDEVNDDLKLKISNSKILIYFILGSLGLYFGSSLLVRNAVLIATDFKVSEFIIGVSVVAIGTSLPELITSLVAILKGENSISLGNLIGSNIFNVFAVLGVSSLIDTMPVDQIVIDYDLIIMLGFVLLTGVFMFLTKKITQIHGLILVVAYISYLAFSFI